MRLVIVSITVISLLFLSSNGLAQQTKPQNPPPVPAQQMENQHPTVESCKTSRCPGGSVRITLKTGKKIDGDLHLEDRDHIEIHRKGAVQSFLRAEIKKVEFRTPFWRKVKTALFYAAISPLMAFWYAYLWIGCGGPDKCFNGD